MFGFTLETDIGLGFEIWLEVRNLLHWRGQGVLGLLVTTLLGGASQSTSYGSGSGICPCFHVPMAAAMQQGAHWSRVLVGTEVPTSIQAFEVWLGGATPPTSDYAHICTMVVLARGRHTGGNRTVCIHCMH